MEKEGGVLIKLHPLIKVESLPYLKVLPPWYLFLVTKVRIGGSKGNFYFFSFFSLAWPFA
jgi:hypothetical protein